MFLVPKQPQQHAFVNQHVPSPRAPRTSTTSSPNQLGSQSPEAPVGRLLKSIDSSMERSASEYTQSGLPSPYPSAHGDTQSEASSADHASAAQYSSAQEARSGISYSTSATPTSEYSVYPPSARSSSFPDHIQRAYQTASNHSGSSGGMAQTPTNPSIAEPSPTYGHHSQYSPYGAPPQDMAHNYPSSGGMYATRPDWANYGQPGGHMPHPQHVFPGTPTSAAPPGRPTQVYSFVPIPGAQQHKRPRRRYEEIERMYKCGWNGCEKAYGTLNHLNAHVTMQSHGQKRTPEEFKEIRKEWKARKKEEDQQRKAAEEADRQRHAQAAAAQAQAQNGAPGPDGPGGGQSAPYSSGGRPQLPPIGYQPNQYPAPPSGSVPQQSLPEYSPTNHIYPNYQPASPYANPNQQMYNQHHASRISS